MASKRGIWWLAVSLAVSGMALAQRAYVGIEQRLSAGQIREIGLTPAQLALLDRYLREAEASAPRLKLRATTLSKVQASRIRRVMPGSTWRESPAR